MKPFPWLLTLLAATLAWPGHGYGQSGGALMAPEQLAMSDPIQYALENNPTNQSSDWVNPDTGNSGGIVPVRTFTDGQKGPCREFVSTIIIGGEQQQGYGTACRQPDGSWQLVSNPSTVQTPPPANQTHIYVTHPPPQYYYYPADFYGPYRIYLSFGYVYRGGYAYRGAYFLDGHSFRYRHPIHVRERIFISPRDLEHRHWFDHRHRERSIERNTIHRSQERRHDRVWRDRDRGNDRRVFKDRGGRSRGEDSRGDRGRGEDSRGGAQSLTSKPEFAKSKIAKMETVFA